MRDWELRLEGSGLPLICRPGDDYNHAYRHTLSFTHIAPMATAHTCTRGLNKLPWDLTCGWLAKLEAGETLGWKDDGRERQTSIVPSAQAEPSSQGPDERQ